MKTVIWDAADQLQQELLMVNDYSLFWKFMENVKC